MHGMDYRLQANRQTLEGASHPDRDAQFQHISDKIRGVSSGTPADVVKDAAGDDRDDPGREHEHDGDEVEHAALRHVD